jgi:hypothetical protein
MRITCYKLRSRHFSAKACNQNLNALLTLHILIPDRDLCLLEQSESQVPCAGKRMEGVDEAALDGFGN